MNCGGWGVLAWVRVQARALSLDFVSLHLWCCGLHGVVLVLVVRLFGRWLGVASCFGLGSGLRLMRTSVRRCVGAGAGWGVFPVCCRAAWVDCVGNVGSPVVWRAAAALAFAVAL